MGRIIIGVVIILTAVAASLAIPVLVILSLVKWLAT